MLMVGATPQSLVEITPDPSSLSWGLQDISSSDAGRVQDSGNTMYKMRVSQKRKLDVVWTLVTDAQASSILRAFNPEYFYVRYFDVMDEAWQVRQFYAGDRTAPFKWFQLPLKGTRLATVSFNIIER